MNINQEIEIQKFNAIEQNDWWYRDGSMKMLHIINELRVQFILEQIKQLNKKNNQINILDIGCGGGILSANLSRLCFNVTGIDASENTIKIAQEHAQKSELDIKFLQYELKDHQKISEKFDVIIGSEILEHLSAEETNNFFQLCKERITTNGIIIISTINRTIKSLLGAKIAAEYLLKIVPQETHQWKNFIQPSELNEKMKEYGFKINNKIQGINFNLLKGKWQLSEKIHTNYILSAEKITN